ncbi:MAG: hypothetical protein ACREM3_23815 [Candidatus Rokuibacteriota bacterium]
MERESGRPMAETAHTATGRAGEYARTGVSHLRGRAHELAREAEDQLEQYTGRSLGQWTAEIRDFVRTHPLQALAVTIGVGYVLGKLARRG